MNAGAATQRTSPIRVESLVAISTYKGDLDYGTNFMGVKNGGNPNIYETEIHSGLYRGTILIELDRIGRGRIVSENQKTKFDDSEYITNEEKQKKGFWRLSMLSGHFGVPDANRVSLPIFRQSLLLRLI